MSFMHRVAVKFSMIARSEPRRIAVAYSQGERQSKCENLAQPIWALPLRVACSVRFLAKGITIRIKFFLAFHPAKPSARACKT